MYPFGHHHDFRAYTQPRHSSLIVGTSARTEQTRRVFGLQRAAQHRRHRASPISGSPTTSFASPVASFFIRSRTSFATGFDGFSRDASWLPAGTPPPSTTI